jgi:hypothetical protein
MNQNKEIKQQQQKSVESCLPSMVLIMKVAYMSTNGMVAEAITVPVASAGRLSSRRRAAEDTAAPGLLPTTAVVAAAMTGVTTSAAIAGGGIGMEELTDPIANAVDVMEDSCMVSAKTEERSGAQ